MASTRLRKTISKAIRSRAFLDFSLPEALNAAPVDSVPREIISLSLIARSLYPARVITMRCASLSVAYGMVPVINLPEFIAHNKPRTDTDTEGVDSRFQLAASACNASVCISARKPDRDQNRASWPDPKNYQRSGQANETSLRMVPIMRMCQTTES